jgi:hypothetical protein
VLLVPRTPVATLPDLPAEQLPVLFGAAQRLATAVVDALEADGTFVAMNNRVSQSVPHLHVHVVPRRFKDGLRGFFWPRQKYEDDGTVVNTHLVSGRRGFPKPGNYAVFSRSPVTRSGSVSMQYMVRWYQSPRLAVGFHSIPVTRRGRPIQSESQLGTFRSHGCVRQRLADAKFVWDWAPIGTPVVVVP